MELSVPLATFMRLFTKLHKNSSTRADNKKPHLGKAVANRPSAVREGVNNFRIVGLWWKGLKTFGAPYTSVPGENCNAPPLTPEELTPQCDKTY